MNSFDPYQYHLKINYSVESVRIQSFFRSEWGKYGPGKIPYLDTFHTVLMQKCLTFGYCR